MEEHEFPSGPPSQSNEKNGSQHTGVGSDADYSGDNEGQDDGESDSGSSHAKSTSQQVASAVYNTSVPISSNHERSPIFSSLDAKSGGVGESITSLALSYPKALLTMPPPLGNAFITAPPPPSNNNALPFSPWRAASLSKPAAVLLDSVEHHHAYDHDSVSSTATSTTAESSFSAMVSRDWGAITTNQEPSGGASTASQGGDSLAGGSTASAPVSAKGVHFRCGHSRLLASNSPGHCGATSSLAHALNKFNIDSDCDVSIASNSILGGGNSIMTEEEDNNMMEEDDASCDDTASRASHTSHISSSDNDRPGHVISSNMSNGSSKSQLSSSIRERKKKIGKAQRLMERAVAHERILQIRSDRSQKSRAHRIHSQRMSHAPSGLTSTFPQAMQFAVSSSSDASMPLLHVQHGNTSRSHDHSFQQVESINQESSSLDGVFHGNDPLGRTPTASNCSDFRKLNDSNELIPRYLSSLLYPGVNTLPVGVHLSSNNREVLPLQLQELQRSTNQVVMAESSYKACNDAGKTIPRPLECQPRLAFQIPTPPHNLIGKTPNPNEAASSLDHPTPSQADVESSMKVSHFTMHHADHQASVDDVLEVAMTLSKLGGRGTMIPRVR